MPTLMRKGLGWDVLQSRISAKKNKIHESISISELKMTCSNEKKTANKFYYSFYAYLLIRSNC